MLAVDAVLLFIVCWDSCYEVQKRDVMSCIVSVKFPAILYLFLKFVVVHFVARQFRVRCIAFSGVVV